MGGAGLLRPCSGRSSILVGRSCRGAPAEPRDGRSGGALGGTAERSRRDERVCRRSRRGVFASPTTPSFSTRSVVGASAWCVLPANDKNRYLRGQSGFRRPQGIHPEGTPTSQTGGGALNICTLGLSLVWGPKWGTLQRASVGSAGTSQNDKNRYLRGQSGFRRPQGILPEGTTTSQTGDGALNICTLCLSLVASPSGGSVGGARLLRRCSAACRTEQY